MPAWAAAENKKSPLGNTRSKNLAQIETFKNKLKPAGFDEVKVSRRFYIGFRH